MIGHRCVSWFTAWSSEVTVLIAVTGPAQTVLVLLLVVLNDQVGGV